jgi:hypothetical protein
MNAWPFLFTAGFYLEHQIVVCPDIFADVSQKKAFRSELAEIHSSGPSNIEVKEITIPQIGKITIVFRVEKAIENSEPARDMGNRIISRVSGFVAKNSTTNIDPKEQSILFSQAMDAVNPRFEEFWRSDVFTTYWSSNEFTTYRPPPIPIPIPSVKPLNITLIVLVVGLFLSAGMNAYLARRLAHQPPLNCPAPASCPIPPPPAPQGECPKAAPIAPNPAAKQPSAVEPKGSNPTSPEPSPSGAPAEQPKAPDSGN